MLELYTALARAKVFHSLAEFKETPLKDINSIAKITTRIIKEEQKGVQKNV